MSDSVTPVLLGLDLGAYSMAAAFFAATGTVSHAFGRYRCGVSSFSRFIIPHTARDFDTASVALPMLFSFADLHKHENLLLVPCTDWYLELVEENRTALSERFCFYIPEYNHFRMLSDKGDFYELCAGAGIPFPQYKCIKGNLPLAEEIFSAAEYPAVLKPSDSTLYWRYPFDSMKKVYTVKSAGEAIAISRTIRKAGYPGDLILQKQIGNGDARLSVLTTFSDASCHVVRAVEGEVLLAEIAPRAIGNYAAVLTGLPSPFAYRLISFLDKIGYCGFANFDMISDGIDRYVLECNPRQGRSVDHLRAAGLNPASLLISGAKKEILLPDFEVCHSYWHAVSHGTVCRFAKNSEGIKEAKRLRKQGASYSPFATVGEGMCAPIRLAYSMIHKHRLDRIFRKNSGGGE